MSVRWADGVCVFDNSDGQLLKQRQFTHGDGSVAFDDPMLDMLIRLQQHPAQYIGKHSVEALFLYLAGYRDAARDLSDRDSSRYSEFVEGLYAKYGRGGGGNSWAWVLDQVAGGDAHGLDLFFGELDEFLRRHNTPGTPSAEN
jgi:hypothetical protein